MCNPIGMLVSAQRWDTVGLMTEWGYETSSYLASSVRTAVKDGKLAKGSTASGDLTIDNCSSTLDA